MKTIKLFLIMLLLVSTSTILSQNRLDYTFDSVKTEFNYDRYELIQFQKGEFEYLQITQPSTVTIFKFDERLICINVKMKPVSWIYMQDYISLFNERFTKVSKTEWIGNTNGVEFYIKLYDKSYFIFQKI